MPTRKHVAIIAGVTLLTLVLLAINILLPYPRRPPPPAALDKLQIISARLHPTSGDGKRHLEITTNQPIAGDTSYKVIFGTKTGYRVDGTGFLTTRERVAGPVFLINVLELARFDEADKKKLLAEHVKAGNIHWVEVAIYDRGEFLHNPDTFSEERKIAQARFDEL